MWNASKLLGTIAALAMGLATGSAHAGYWVTLQNDLDGRCLDADARAPAGTEGARVQMWDCNGSDQQRWYVDADPNNPNIGFATLQNGYSKTCLKSSYTGQWDIFTGQPPTDPNGTAVTLSRCDPNNTGFLWRVKSDHALLSSDDNRMILDYNPSTRGNGGQVYLWSAAEFSPAQQRWHLVPTSAPRPPEPAKPTSGGTNVTPPPPTQPASQDHLQTVVCACSNGSAAADVFCMADATKYASLQVICERFCCFGDCKKTLSSFDAYFRGQGTTACNLQRVFRDESDWSESSSALRATPASDASVLN